MIRMTEKRFEPNYDGRLIIDNQTGKEYEFHSGAEEPVIELLNSLQEEKEELERKLNSALNLLKNNGLI